MANFQGWGRLTPIHLLSFISACVEPRGHFIIVIFKTLFVRFIRHREGTVTVVVVAIYIYIYPTCLCRGREIYRYARS